MSSRIAKVQECAKYDRRHSVLVIAMIFTSCISGAIAEARQAMVDHPVTDFNRTTLAREEHERRVAHIAGRTHAEMRRLFVEEPRNSVVIAEHYEAAASSAVALWGITGEHRYRELAVEAYRAALGELAAEPEGFFHQQVSHRGSVENVNNYARPLLSATDLYALRDACLHLAVLYHLTGDMSAARKSAILLSRFAEQIPKWPVYYPTRADLAAEKAGGTIGHMDRWYDFKAYPQKGPGMNFDQDATGPWGIWYYEDIESGMPLARAYDLIHDSGAMQDIAALASIESMLRGHVEFQRAFPETFSNMDGVQKIGILTFARILGEPEWVHEVVWWLRAIYQTQFYADGWWHEGSPAYHAQIFGRLHVICRDFLQGYSDPPGFVSRLDGTRFDNLDVLGVMARPFARSDQVLGQIAQPNGLVQVLGDTHFGQRAPGPPMTEARSVLFGCRGHAILGTGQGGHMTQVSLSFGGSHGHDHADGLNLLLFAKGKELISETTYSPMHPNTTREWHTMTAGHVTVLVDELQQNSWVQGREHTPARQRQPEDAIPGIPDWPWRWSGHGNIMNDGFLRVFNTEFDRVQVVEADAERRYGSSVQLERYRRTVALVTINESDCYVVDIFRVKGGMTHDYMLHSCLDLPHGVETSIPLEQELPGTLYRYLTELRSAQTGDGWTATFTLEDGSAALRSFVLPAAGTQIIRGMAPAMRRPGTAPFLAVRRTGGESVFAVVHHPFTGRPLVEKVELLPVASSDPMAVAIRVVLPHRVDTIVSTTGPDQACAAGDKEMKGRFAHFAEGNPEDSWQYWIDGPDSPEGMLSRTYRVEAGDGFDAFVTDVPLPMDGSMDGRTLVADLGGTLVQGFRIRKIERQGAETIIYSMDEPGMTISPGLIKLEYFPGWGIKGEARFRIPMSVFWDARRKPL